MHHQKVYSAGEKLSFQENKEDGFYCVQQGHGQVGYADDYKSGVVRICGPGDLIGYETSSGKIQALALDQMKVCFFPRNSFLNLQKNNSDIANGVIQSLVRIIGVKNERIIGLENHSIKNRIAATLVSLMKKFGTPSEYGTLIDLKIDRKTLAKLAGTVVESLARILTEFENEKIIVREGRKIHVADKEKLLKYLAM